jgi:hypothetical protein
MSLKNDDFRALVNQPKQPTEDSSPRGGRPSPGFQPNWQQHGSPGYHQAAGQMGYGGGQYGPPYQQHPGPPPQAPFYPAHHGPPQLGMNRMYPGGGPHPGGPPGPPHPGQLHPGPPGAPHYGPPGMHAPPGAQYAGGAAPHPSMPQHLMQGRPGVLPPPSVPPPAIPDGTNTSSTPQQGDSAAQSKAEGQGPKPAESNPKPASSASVAKGPVPSEAARGDAVWVAYRDSTDGAVYYHNRSPPHPSPHPYHPARASLHASRLNSIR